MSSPESSPDGIGRRALVSWAALLPLAACGLAPVYGAGGPGLALRGRVAVEAPDTPDGFTLRAALEDRLGSAPGAEPAAALVLEAAPTVAAVAAAITPSGAITRYDLSGTAPWRLSGPAGEAASGEARAFTGYSATGTTVATRSAEADARARLMALLADAIVTRLLLLPPGSIPGAAP